MRFPLPPIKLPPGKKYYDPIIVDDENYIPPEVNVEEADIFDESEFNDSDFNDSVSIPAPIRKPRQAVASEKAGVQDNVESFTPNNEIQKPLKKINYKSPSTTHKDRITLVTKISISHHARLKIQSFKTHQSITSMVESWIESNCPEV